MKKTYGALLGLGLLMAGCKEKDTLINFGNSTTPSTDSAYVGPVPATQPHNVLIEEFTGQDCPACPSGHATLDAIAAQAGNEGRINIVSVYYEGGTQTQPPAGAKYDFRIQASSDLSNLVYGRVNGIPSAGIDRVPYQGKLYFESTNWPDAINSRKAEVDSLNLGVESSFANGTATIKVTVTYTKEVVNPNNLSVYVVEDSMVDVQAKGLVLDNNYLFLDVLREMLTTAGTGDPFLQGMAVKQPGQVYWRKYTYKPDLAKINPAHCRVVAFVNNPGIGGDYKVLQSAQCRLVP